MSALVVNGLDQEIEAVAADAPHVSLRGSLKGLCCPGTDLLFWTRILYFPSGVKLSGDKSVLKISFSTVDPSGKCYVVLVSCRRHRPLPLFAYVHHCPGYPYPSLQEGMHQTLSGGMCSPTSSPVQRKHENLCESGIASLRGTVRNLAPNILDPSAHAGSAFHDWGAGSFCSW